MKLIFVSGAKHAQPGLWQTEYWQVFQVGLRSVSHGWAMFMFILVVGGALLAACAAGPTGPVANSKINPAYADDGSAVAQVPISTGELRFFVMPADALVGGMARADQVGR
jgi:hypothetical protein